MALDAKVATTERLRSLDIGRREPKTAGTVFPKLCTVNKFPFSSAMFRLISGYPLWLPPIWSVQNTSLSMIKANVNTFSFEFVLLKLDFSRCA